MTRTDVHSPTNLVTEDYEYMYAADTEGPWALGLARDFLRELANYPPETAERANNQCHHCGAHIRYVAWLRHMPTGYVICVGETCLDNRFDRATADFQRLRKAAKLDREREAVAAKREAFRSYLPEELEWLVDNDETPELVAWCDFARDLHGQFRRKGHLSEKQVKALLKLWNSSKAKAEAPQEPEPTWIDAPTGRIEVTGTVLTTKVTYNDFGAQLKMLLKVDTEAGSWKLWATVPSKASNVDHGDELNIRVTVKPSGDDPSFAFGSRPTVIQL
jgi:hypothetical protein